MPSLGLSLAMSVVSSSSREPAGLRLTGFRGRYGIGGSGDGSGRHKAAGGFASPRVHVVGMFCSFVRQLPDVRDTGALSGQQEVAGVELLAVWVFWRQNGFQGVFAVSKKPLLNLSQSRHRPCIAGLWRCCGTAGSWDWRFRVFASCRLGERFAMLLGRPENPFSGLFRASIQNSLGNCGKAVRRA